ncbi:MAG: acyl-[acyl-carrier-protein] thioesterase [Rhodospirillales bacterium]
MTNWIETYRGAVPPWQCDTTEHFTVAYYADRLEEAETSLAEAIGLGEAHRVGGYVRRIDLRYARELRAGAAFHVLSAPLGTDGTSLRLGHRFIDSGSGETVTWVDEHWEIPVALREQCSGNLAVWEGPIAEQRADPVSDTGFVRTAGGRVKPADLDATGHFSLSGMVHRFSSANAHAAVAMGMDTAYMQRNRRGFSTFEMALKISGVLRLDEPYTVETGIAHLGNSSLRLVHRMTNTRTGTVVARLGQFGVNLDLDARRPARWTDEVRDKAVALLVT